MEEADTMKFSVPRNLQADLRDYQKEGFRWLCRLAHWGAGACLADDMGLGKTIQTIALLLSKAKEGASLVIMPTSVLLNWKNELTRFAPSLNPIIMRDSNDRAETVNNAGAQDVVLATYGLLPTEEDILTAKKWNVIVLDEAHTIKNKDTKTSKVFCHPRTPYRLHPVHTRIYHSDRKGSYQGTSATIEANATAIHPPQNKERGAKRASRENGDHAQG